MTEKPRRFEDAAAELMTPKVPTGDPDEDVVIEDVDPEAAAAGDEDPDAPKKDEGLPEWAVLPENLKVPRGRTLFALRFLAAWTDRPDLGDRVVLLWNLTEADEKLALRRVGGDSKRAIDELSKQMVRAIDGHKANWRVPGPHNPSTFYTDVGGKCRQMLKTFYAKNHTLSSEETQYFFFNCVAVVTSVG